MPVLLLFSLLLITFRSLPAAEHAAKSPNVLLITVDTLRADHLSCYGYGLKTTPYIDKLAAEGVRFERAYTAIPLTGPAHFSLFTSRYPHEHGARRNGVAMASDTAIAAWPQILRANGYRSAAFVSAWPLTARLTGLDAWFDHYDENLTRTYQMVNSSRWAEDVTPLATNWLKQNGQGDKPFFLWVHYFDPHAPYTFRKHFADLARTGVASVQISDAEMRERIRNYDTEVAYTDWYIGKLLSAVDDIQLTDSTLVILMSDHGESLGEHDYVGHGRHLYENILRVPLIMRLPSKVKAGQVISTPVSILDVAPTVLDLTVQSELAQSKAPLRFSGRTLAPSITHQQTLAQRRFYPMTFPGKKGFAPQWLSWIWIRDEELPLRLGYIDRSSKFVWAPEERKLFSYDIGHDPQEMHPRAISAGTGPYEAETERLKSWYSRGLSASGEERTSQKDVEVLKSLGYIQ